MPTDDLLELNGTPVLVCGAEGPPIAGPQDALDLIGACYQRAEVVAVPVGRFDPEFFRLRSGLAGEVLQKFTNYRIHLVVVGDISDRVGAGTAVHDLVTESNRGRQTWFVADLEELAARLG